MDNLREQLKEKIFSKFHKDSWEIKTIEEIATEIISGNEITKVQIGTGEHPAIRIKEVYDSPQLIDSCINFVDPKLVKRKKYCEYGDILLASTSENLRDFGKSCVYLGKEKCLVGNDIKIIKHNQNPKFLAYSFSSENFQREIKKCAEGGNVLHLYLNKLHKIKIPLPSLEIQQEIVEFLDKFTELERELEGKLERRKKQYEFYKNLVFNRGIEELNWKMRSIEEIAMEIISGTEVTRAQLGTGNHPAIKCGDINSSLPLQFGECISFVDSKLIKKPKYFKKNDVLISKMSNKASTVGTAATYFGEGEVFLGGDIDAIRHKQNPKYLAFVLSTAFARNQIENLAQESTVFHLYTKNIKQIKIPLPSLDVQERIAEDLDKLYRIVHDFKEGIPFLIKKNREQYNFYKELILER